LGEDEVGNDDGAMLDYLSKFTKDKVDKLVKAGGVTTSLLETEPSEIRKRES